MNFNFYEEFKNHSNEELITIARQTDAYQPEAVAAAYQHLNERNVSENEILGITQMLESPSFAATNEDGQEDLLVPHFTIQPTGVFSNKWINILFGVIVLQFLSKAYFCFVEFYTYRAFYITHFSQILKTDFFITFLLLPILFLLIIKRYKLTWFILFAPNLLAALVVIARKATAIAYDYVDNYAALLTPAVAVAVSAAYVVILWKDEVASLFSISKSTKQKTALIVLGLSFLLWLFQPQ